MSTDSEPLQIEPEEASYAAMVKTAELWLPRILPECEEYNRLAKKEDGLYHPSYPLKQLELWAFCLRLQPQRIVELGCGGTTLVFSKWAKRSGAHVVVVDEARWFSVLSSRWPALDVTFLGAEVKRTGSEAWYDWRPENDIDLLYVDGPYEGDGDGVGVDAVNITGAVKVANVLFDYRLDAVDKLRSVERGYSFEPSPMWAFCNGKCGLSSFTRHHSWFRRSDVSV